FWLRAGFERRPERGAKWIQKRRRRHAHDRIVLTVQLDSSSDYPRVCAKASLPESIAEDDGPFSARPKLFSEKHSPDLSLPTKQGKKFWRNNAPCYPFDRIGVG